ncbi:putative transcriptional regulatory protein [Cyphellophora attinorum]|uniref:Putative transcriptional regulatory protein n=1 Tax=Cyphellophora attinorum TaxID=1664694 RepID=A0A0N1P1J4_9EURO|nr:putative transcriptional regulatory protein [Phialophora attinorum]KPI40836.1 putative transcriptional regulatory protein [Phialophora attinorum]
MPRTLASSEKRGHVSPGDRTRRRPISCLLCRARKLKCDHALPACGNCVNRGDITACRYVPRKNEARATALQVSDLPGAAQAKIDNLERLLITFMSSQQQPKTLLDTPPGSSATESFDVDGSGNSPVRQTTFSSAAPETGLRISADYKQSSSVDHAHWALLLDEIEDVRSFLQTKHSRSERPSGGTTDTITRSIADPGPSLLFGTANVPSRAEILSQLPSKYTCDMFVDRFFAHLYPAIHVLHEPVFRKQYQQFWSNSRSTPMAWLAMLFAILRIASLDYLREEDEPLEHQAKCADLASTFRHRLTDCLIAADYTRPQEFLIETLILHLYAEYVSSRDAKSTVWVLVGMIVRLAMRMGYHQERQPTMRATPFHAEMRRRVWTFIQQCDILVSFQMGLPSMTAPASLEASLPRNIHDEGGAFDEDCTALPPALPDSVPTKISYLIAKARLASGLARALDEVNRTPAPTWENVLEIDRKLRQIYDNVADHWKLGELSAQDSLVLTSLAIHDYLLAATIIAADLYSNNASPGDTSGVREVYGVPTQTEMIKSLRTAGEIFGRQTESAEARKAANVLRMIVDKVGPRRRHCGVTSRARQATSEFSRMTTTVSPSQNAGPTQSYRPTLPDPLASARSSQGLQPAGQLEETIAQARELTSLEFAPWSHSVSGNQSVQEQQGRHHLPAFGFPGSWTASKDIPTFTDPMLNDPIAQDWLPFSSPLSLADPMASLWTMCSASQEDFSLECPSP